MAIQIYNKQQRAAQANTPSAIMQRPLGNVPNPTRADTSANKLRARNIQSISGNIQTLANLYIEEKNRNDDFEVSNAISQLEKAQLEFETGYRNSNQGKLALNAGTDFEENFKKSSDEVLKNLDVSDRAKMLFSSRAQSMQNSSLSRGSSYASQQDGIYKKQSIEGMRATHAQLIATNPYDHQRIAESKNALNIALQNAFPGQDHTAQYAQWNKEDAAAQLNAALANEDLKSAKAYFEEYKPYLQEQAPRFQQMIDSLQEEKNNEYKKNTMNLAVSEAMQAYNGSGETDLNKGIAAIANNKNLSLDEQQEAVTLLMNGIEAQDKMNKFRKAEQDKKQKQEIANFFSTAQTPENAYAYIKELPAEMKEHANAFYDRMLNGDDGVSSAETLADIRTQISTRQINSSNFAQIKQENMPFIANKDWIKLESEMNKKEETFYADYSKTMFRADMQNVWKDKYTATELNQMYDYLDAQAFEMGIFDPKEKSNFILNQAQKVTVDEGFWSSEKELTPLEAKKFYSENPDAEISVPQESRAQIIQVLNLMPNKKGNITEKDIQEMYIQQLNRQ